jgi:hypothetical protein
MVGGVLAEDALGAALGLQLPALGRGDEGGPARILLLRFGGHVVGELGRCGGDDLVIHLFVFVVDFGPGTWVPGHKVVLGGERREVGSDEPLPMLRPLVDVEIVAVATDLQEAKMIGRLNGLEDAAGVLEGHAREGRNSRDVGHDYSHCHFCE